MTDNIIAEAHQANRLDAAIRAHLRHSRRHHRAARRRVLVCTICPTKPSATAERCPS